MRKLFAGNNSSKIGKGQILFECGVIGLNLWLNLLLIDFRSKIPYI